MKIEPLSKETLNEAIKLVVDIFNSKPHDFDYPGKWMSASIAKEKDKKLYASANCTYVKYYAGIDEFSGKVIGTTGIYTQKDDEKDSDWIAWFCVDPNFRGKGYGSKLLDFTIDLAKKRGKKFIRLYTSYNTDIKKAMELYSKRGFKITNIKKHPNTKEEMIYMESRLK
jgi:GNAT superfamily N-acetyltransferase